jgi:hypothetical protein
VYIKLVRYDLIFEVSPSCYLTTVGLQMVACRKCVGMFMIYFRNRIYEPYLNGLLVVTFRWEPKVFEPLTVLHSAECSAG